MRYRIGFIGFAIAAVAGCDRLTAPVVASAGGSTGQTSANTSTSLAVVPNQVQLAVGATVQLTTTAPANQQAQVQWSSLNPSIAAVSATGLVTALAPGAAVIRARYAFDTTRTATATINVL